MKKYCVLLLLLCVGCEAAPLHLTVSVKQPTLSDQLRSLFNPQPEAPPQCVGPNCPRN